MSTFDTVLVVAVPAALVYGLIALLVVMPRRARRPRYRVGQPWPYQPLFWTANPQGAQLPAPEQRVVTGERGGARGDW
ncbi:aa3-type cytochrome oxidase subunit CtaJ [Pseudonocardia sp.]|uniref:aa3-type cytochrome oxidase subunit CtaJ n=1 Tax=Pseudonocardia sp. TaxID=60912 RepID=UPI003D10B06A